jgi:hypothetical protein
MSPGLGVPPPFYRSPPSHSQDDGRKVRHIFYYCHSLNIWS